MRNDILSFTYISQAFLFLPKVNTISSFFALPEITHSFTKTDTWNEMNR